MWTATLFSRPALIWWARSRRPARARWPWTLKYWLTAHHALRTLSRPTLTLHGPCAWRSLHRSPLWSARRSHARRWCRVNGTRPCLRRNHSSLRHNRLAWHRLGRWRSCGSSLRSCRHWRRCRRLLRCRWRRCNNNCWRMSGRGDHNCGRSSRLFNGRRRNHCRRHWLDHRRCNHNTSFRCWSSRFWGNDSRLFSCRRRCHGRCLHLCWRSSRRGCGNRHFGRRRGRMLLLLLSLPEQPCYVARLGNLGEVDLRFDLGRGRFFPRRRAGPGRKMLSYPYRFIFLNRA